MTDPTLTDYILQAQQAGMSEAQIFQALLDVGWDEAIVRTVLNPASSTVAVPTVAPATLPNTSLPVKTVRRPIVLAVAVAMGALLIGGGTTVAFAEQGYLPAVSLLYRKTSVPAVWKGMSGSPEVAFYQIFHALAPGTSATTKGSWKVSVSTTSAGTATLMKNQQLAEAFTSRNLADVPAGGTAVAATSSPTTFPPLSFTISGTDDLAAAPDNSISEDATLDLADLRKNAPQLEQVFGTIPTTLTANLVLTDVYKTFYGKSNILPYLNGDEGKWFKVAIPDTTAKELQDNRQKQASPTTEDLGLWKKVIDTAVQDMGVERKNGAPVSHYRLVLNQQTRDALKKVLPASSAVGSAYERDLIDLTDSSIDGTMDVWVGQWSHQPVAVSADLHGAVGGTTIGFTAASTTTYGTPAKSVALPAANQLITTPATEYLLKAYQQKMDSGQSSSVLGGTELESARKKARDASRRSDLVEAAKAVELYKSDDSNTDASPPASLDVLAQKNLFIAPNDPSTGKPYSYIVSGKSYTLSATLEDPASCGGHSTYVITDGTLMTPCTSH